MTEDGHWSSGEMQSSLMYDVKSLRNPDQNRYKCLKKSQRIELWWKFDIVRKMKNTLKKQ